MSRDCFTWSAPMSAPCRGELRPRSRATYAIGLPVSRTSRTAPSLKSLSNFLRVSPIGELPSSKRISPRWEGKPTGSPPTPPRSPHRSWPTSATPPTASTHSAPTWTASPSSSAATTASSSSAKTCPDPPSHRQYGHFSQQKQPALPPTAVRTHEQPRSKLTNETTAPRSCRNARASGPTAPPPCSSQPTTTPDGSTAKAPTRRCAASARSKPPPATPRTATQPRRRPASQRRSLSDHHVPASLGPAYPGLPATPPGRRQDAPGKRSDASSATSPARSSHRYPAWHDGQALDIHRASG